MANNISKTVTIFIDGKQVDATLKSLQAELKKLRNQQRSATIGSKEYIETSLRMREIEKIIAEQKDALNALGRETASKQCPHSSFVTCAACHAAPILKHHHTAATASPMPTASLVKFW